MNPADFFAWITEVFEGSTFMTLFGTAPKVLSAITSYLPFVFVSALSVLLTLVIVRVVIHLL